MRWLLSSGCVRHVPRRLLLQHSRVVLLSLRRGHLFRQPRAQLLHGLRRRNVLQYERDDLLCLPHRDVQPNPRALLQVSGAPALGLHKALSMNTNFTSFPRVCFVAPLKAVRQRLLQRRPRGLVVLQGVLGGPCGQPPERDQLLTLHAGNVRYSTLNDGGDEGGREGMKSK